jgi:2'-5' RNA ligase
MRGDADNLLFLPNRARPAALALGLEDEIGYGCFVRGRAFKPHITLARKGESPLRLSPGKMGVCFGVKGLVETIAVVKSDLYRDEPIYTRLAVFSLKGG